MQYLQSLYRGIQIAKPKCCAYAPVSNRQVLLFLDRLDLSIYHASGHPCITASPSRHMTLLQPPSAYIRLGRPPLHSVGQSVRLTARSSARAQLMARFFGYLAARGKSGDSRVSGTSCWMVSSDGASDAAPFLGPPPNTTYQPTSTQRLFPWRCCVV